MTTFEILDADYADIDSLRNIDITNTVRYRKRVKNCIQNVLQICITKCT